MVYRRKLKNQPEIISLEVPLSSDLPSRIEKISEQTGLSLFNLFQKWVLQEESMIELVQRGKERTITNIGSQQDSDPLLNPDVQESKETLEVNPNDGQNYRKMLLKRAIKLKKEGTTLKTIAETFNSENLPTVSGTGKWYSSSVAWLLSTKRHPGA